jgi:glycosyltransferase involved in cell wall biosynthesis
MYPDLRENLEVTAGLRYEGQDVDVVIVDRLWRPDISRALAESLVEGIHRAGAKLVYALDDNLPDLPARRLPLVSRAEAWPTDEHRWIVRFLLGQADRSLPPLGSPFGQRRKVIGYMGTMTHDDDLMMVLPALRAMWERHPEEIEFQLVGVIGQGDTLQALEGLPVRVVGPNPDEMEYPLFLLWFTSRLCWDIAISPLRESPFNSCKSDIKFLDYSAIGAAGIYSRVPAYEPSVRHLETGWLVKNDVAAWVDALETLLVQDSVRMQLAQNATQYLYTERILAHCTPIWMKALTYLLGEPESDC